jgi:DNA-binding NarL/FixJ family response regulator
VRLLIVDDVAAIREALIESLVGTGIEVVGEASNGLEGVEQAAALQPDVILLDLRMPVLDGVSAMPLLRHRAPASRIVAYTALDVELTGKPAQWADALLTKSDPIERIVGMIREVAARPRRHDDGGRHGAGAPRG